MKKTGILFIAVLMLMQKGNAQQLPYSQQMVQTAMNMWPDSFSMGGRPPVGVTTRG